MNIQFENFTDNDIRYGLHGDCAHAEILKYVSSGGRLSYPWLRKYFGSDNGLWESLGRGRAILTSHAQLDQYLHSYGPMISSQWGQICTMMQFSDEAYHFIDYGCGQGLAGLLMSDNLKGDLFCRVKEVVLIEPSPVALMRALAIYRGIAQNAVIRCVRKDFDDLASCDLVNDRELPSIHIFSNVLDVPSFDHLKLFRKIFNVGRHFIIAVSHDRNHEGGSKRIWDVKLDLESREESGNVKVNFSEIRNFSCNKSDAIAWLMDLEVIR